MRDNLFSNEERMYVPIEQIAIPSDISIFGSHFGEQSYYADFAGIAKKYAPQRVLEIGVRFGYSGIAMTSGALAGGATPPVQYVGLDAEFFSGHTKDQGYGNYRSNAVAAENFKRFRPGVDAEFFTCDTRNGLPESVLAKQFDLINVDGDHSYEGAYGDLCRVWPLLAPGGVIIVDDTGMADVKRAVEQFRDEHALDLEGFAWHQNERGFAIFLRSGERPLPEAKKTPKEEALEAETKSGKEAAFDAAFRTKRPYHKRK